MPIYFVYFINVFYYVICWLIMVMCLVFVFILQLLKFFIHHSSCSLVDCPVIGNDIQIIMGWNDLNEAASPLW